MNTLASAYLFTWFALYKHQDVLDQLYELFIRRGIPEHIRSSDNSPEFTAKAVRKWLVNLGIKTLYIEPGSPWENGYVESFNSRLRDEFLNRELFLHIDELRYVADRWRMDYNHYRPHGSLSYQTPAVYAEQCRQKGLTQPQLPMPEQEKMAEILS